MARGGAREGAGRKKGGHNRITEEAIEQAKTEGVLPLDFLLSIMRDGDEDKARRLDAAKSAAPYLHAKLSQVEAKIDSDITHHEGSLPPALGFLARYGITGEG